MQQPGPCRGNQQRFIQGQQSDAPAELQQQI